MEEMSTNKSRTPIMSRPRVHPMSVDSGMANSDFATRHPYKALQTVVEARSDGGMLPKSPPSAGCSAVQQGRRGGSGGTNMMASPRGPVSRASPSTPQRGITSGSSQQMRRMSDFQGIHSSPFPSPAMYTAASGNSGFRSPQQVTTPRDVSMPYSPRTPQGPAVGGDRALLARQGHDPRAPILGESEPEPSMRGVPEYLAVQEMAFRQGQKDYGVVRGQIPSSPFAAKFDELWLEYYVLGKAIGGMPKSASAIPQSTSIKNFSWVVLTNPYTQDLEHPEGGVDIQWVRKICGLALDCMAALIATVCRREHEWKRLVCDVPSPIREAIMHFEDLERRYRGLQKDAKEALDGGIPAGY